MNQPRRNDEPPSPRFLYCRLSVYWLWLTVACGGMLVVPWADRVSGVRLPLVWYCRLQGEGWPSLLFGHTLIAVLAAVPLGAIHAARCRIHDEHEPIQFSLGRMMAGISAFAVALGILSYCKAPPLVLGAATLVFAGWPISVMLAGWLYHRGLRRKSEAASVANDESAR